MKSIIPLSFLAFFFVQAQAQVPVSKEPRHHLVLENDKVRVLNVLVPPGDTTQYHVHSTPSVFLCFTKTTTASQLQYQQPVTGTSAAGSIWFENLAPPHTKTHRVMNQDTSVFHVMDVELLAKDSGFSQAPLALSHLQLVVDTPWARAYKLQLSKGEQISIQGRQSPLLLVAVQEAHIRLIQNGSAKSPALRPGAFFWIRPNESIQLSNSGETPVSFALFEVK